MFTKNVFTQILTATVLLGFVAGVQAESDPEEIIKFRQNVMKSSGANMAAAGAIVQGKVEFKDRLLDHAKAIEASTKNIPALFPAGSDFGTDTKALEGVWKNRAEFEKLSKDSQAKAVAFTKAVAAKDANLGPKFKDLSESCKACHKDYRKKEDKQ